MLARAVFSVVQQLGCVLLASIDDVADYRNASVRGDRQGFTTRALLTADGVPSPQRRDSDRPMRVMSLSDVRARCCTTTLSRHVRSQNTICSIDIPVGAHAIFCRLRSGSRTPRRGLVLHRRLVVATSAQCAGPADSRAHPGPGEYFESFVRERRRPIPACTAGISPVVWLSEGVERPSAAPLPTVVESPSLIGGAVHHG